MSRLLLAAFALCASLTRPASADSERSASYSFEIAWPTAIRFLRIDENLIIVERDPDIGYVMFKLVEKNREFNGSMEVMRTTDQEGRKAVRMRVRIPQRPAYMEAGILDRLVQRLYVEHGPPPDPPKKPDPPPPAEEKPAEDKPAGEKKPDDTTKTNTPAN